MPVFLFTTFLASLLALSISQIGLFLAIHGFLRRPMSSKTVSCNTSLRWFGRRFVQFQYNQGAMQPLRASVCRALFCVGTERG
ncbi:hypothetical protein FB45DRAFT_464450 [Roridomyces roridus]|uniref:Uncharacterized protein n=1 Tax=Roridomyces roridus TaxID=1738132 RepID=A0AAD7F6V2_9AGAR|nr:hypothetical protein FB45DRAFT_464450 [Roridomyces roridus]